MKKILISALALIFVFALAGIALAIGPHGGYVSTTDLCDDCHDVHDSAGGIGSMGYNVLLRWATVRATCATCHDQSNPQAGINVINAVPSPVASHIKETTKGSSSVGIPTPLDSTLVCTSCHSPHDNPLRVITFFFSCDTSVVATSHLLLRDPDPTPAGTNYTYYGGQWCGDCHTSRHTSLSSVNNHPINPNQMQYAGGPAGVTRTAGSLAMALQRHNVNFSMKPASTTAGDMTAPICQNCHEDYRDVETAFVIPTFYGGTPTGTNPGYFAFPHESQMAYFRVESKDDLCLNCHSTGSLP